ncbi:MAG: hypothetical protein A3J76_03565 [Candidatus Moranbacteria bacterium RBG_13_45_13]|nr:MAG: hypothetical protein A3J76_03565 [Candidatus Moranbacteria bacterium RBG_13_45_13]
MALNIFWEKTKRFVKGFFLIDDTPHKIAAGAALGVFFGISPGEGVATTLIFATLLRFNRLAATAGVLAVNMWTTILVLPLAAGTGALIFGKNYSELLAQFHAAKGNYLELFFSKIFFFDITLPLLVGFFVVAGIIALLVYAGLLFLVVRRQKHKKNEHLFRKTLEN